ncbi:MAG: hypothetical protein R3A10_20185 [Caldilineaceae bacterium]
MTGTPATPGIWTASTLSSAPDAQRKTPADFAAMRAQNVARLSTWAWRRGTIPRLPAQQGTAADVLRRRGHQGGRRAHRADLHGRHRRPDLSAGPL